MGGGGVSRQQPEGPQPPPGEEELQPPPPELFMASHQQTRIQAYLEKNKIGPLFEVRCALAGRLLRGGGWGVPPRWPRLPAQHR